MLTAGFLRQKWPQRHKHLVEECVSARRALHVGDVLPDLMEHAYRHAITRWSPPAYPHLTLVSRQAGPFKRWWFVCPGCRRRCESVYALPDVARPEWRCRLCHGLIYASQRCGFRHPLRRVLTRRKKITRQKDARRMERRSARLGAAPSCQIVPPVPGDATDRAIAGLRAFAEMLERKRETATAIRQTRDEQLRALLEVEAERSLSVLRELAQTAGGKREREAARNALARYERRARRTPA